MALQLSRRPSQSSYLNTEGFAISQAGPVYAWHIDKNVAEPVAVAMLPVLTGQIAQRGLLMVVCDASIGAPPLKAFAAAAAAQAILRNYYYKIEPSNYSHMLFQAMQEGIREANDEMTHRFWPNAEQAHGLALTDNLAGISATAVVAYDYKLVIGTVGTTHAYRIRNGKLAMYEQGEPERLIVLKDDFRKGDRVFVCTQALASANGAGRIRGAAKASPTTTPQAIRTLIEEAEQVDGDEIIAAAMLYRNAASPVLLASGRAAVPAPAMMRWLTLVSVLIVLGVGAWLFLENQRIRLAAKASPAAPVLVAPVATSLMPVPVLASTDGPVVKSVPAVSNTNAMSMVITTSEAGVVVFQLAVTETLTPPPSITPAPSATASPTPTLKPKATQTQTVVRATVTAKSAATQAPPAQPTSPPPQPTSLPPQPTSPPPQPTSPPPQPTSPPPQPTSPPPQPTSPPPQPTSPPPQPTPDLVLPCLPGDTQCKP